MPSLHSHFAARAKQQSIASVVVVVLGRAASHSAYSPGHNSTPQLSVGVEQLRALELSFERTALAARRVDVAAPAVDLSCFVCASMVLAQLAARVQRLESALIVGRQSVSSVTRELLSWAS